VQLSQPIQTDQTPLAEGPAGLLNPVELEIIDLFVSAVRILGIPKSVAEIYGMLFVSQQPLPLDEIVERLQISKGSASQGLKLLRNLGAVKPLYVAGDRRDHFVAETELKRLVAGFFKEELEPRVESGAQRLIRLKATMGEFRADQKTETFYKERIAKLAQWHSKGQALIPLLGGLLE
jgi:DNA-binding transcriptional regulator GbsR (MarR family)